MKIYKGVIYTGLGHLSKLLLGFALVKLIAYYHGRSGLGYVANFMSVITIAVSMAGGGITNAVIKYVAEYKNSKYQLVNFISSAVCYSLFFSFLIFFFGIIYSKNTSNIIFGDEKYYIYINWLAISQLAFAFNNFYSGFLNGIGENENFARIQIFSAIIFFPIVWMLISLRSLDGLILAIIITYTSIFFLSLFLCLKNKIFHYFILTTANFTDGGKLLKYSIISVVSAIAFPVAEIMIRGVLIKSTDYTQAGLWQGAMKLSGAYIGFFSTFLAFYFVPRVSFSNEKKYIKLFSFKIMIFISIMFSIGAAVFYIFRENFIVILLSKDFLELKELFKYQLIGDFFRIMAYVVGFLLIAKAAIILSILAEIFQNLLFFGFVQFFSENMSVDKLMKIYAISYFIYFLICFLGLLIYVKNKEVNR